MSGHNRDYREIGTLTQALEGPAEYDRDGPEHMRTECGGEGARDVPIAGPSPPADITGAEHRRRTVQDDYDDECWAYGYAPRRFRDYGPDGRVLHRRRE